MDLVKPKRPVMDSWRRRTEPEENLPVAREKSRVWPENQRLPV